MYIYIYIYMCVYIFQCLPKGVFIDFREGGRGERETETETETERNIDERETLIGCLPVPAWTGDGTHNLGMCPDQESNL